MNPSNKWMTNSDQIVRVDALNAFASFQLSDKDKRWEGEIPNLPWEHFELKASTAPGTTGQRLPVHFLFKQLDAQMFSVDFHMFHPKLKRFILIGGQNILSGPEPKASPVRLSQSAIDIRPHDAESTLIGAIFLALMVVRLLNCKNIGTAEKRYDDALNKSLRRKGQPEHLIHRVITIDLSKTASAASGKPTKDVGVTPLHICRGHFRTYSPERPLFGKIIGTFWIPMYLRGDKKQGQVVKDYQIADEVTE